MVERAFISLNNVASYATNRDSAEYMGPSRVMARIKLSPKACLWCVIWRVPTWTTREANACVVFRRAHVTLPVLG